MATSKRKEEAGGASASLAEAQALSPAPSPVVVKLPLDRDDPESWARPRETVRVYVRPMAADEIVAGIGRLIPVFEKWQTGLTIEQLADDGFAEFIAIVETCTNAKADLLRKLDGEDLLSVFERVYTVNEAFFTRARALVNGEIGQKIRALFVGVGPTQSST